MAPTYLAGARGRSAWHMTDTALPSPSMSAAADGASIEIHPATLADWLASEREPKPEVIDVRELYERDAGHIEGTRHIALVELSGAAGTVSRERSIVFYCRVGARSQMAAEAFRAAGFDAYTMTGGIVLWAAEGRPLHPDDGYVADH